MAELASLSPLGSGAPRVHRARGVELRELRRVAQVRIQALRADRDRLPSPAGEVLPRAPNAVAGSEPWILWRAPGDWLAYALEPTPERLAAILRERLAGAPLLFADLSSASSLLEISGPRAAEVLARDCGLDFEGGGLPPGSCAQTAIAQMTIGIHRPSAAELWRLWVDRSAARHFFSWLVDSSGGPGASREREP
ncbi:MAG: sarcosine oxidase subunit gamma family protein [Thermoanaerobaculia bacterium]